MLSNKMVILTISTIFVFSCSTSQGEHSDNTKIDEGSVFIDGMVSENPPQGGENTSDSNESDTAQDEEQDTGEPNAPVSSYENCSNKISMWTEPDPLSHPCNFRLMNQDGDMVELYDFEGDVILLDFSTLWCGVCKRVAEHVQGLHDQYDPFTAITVITEDASGNPTKLEDVENWSTEYSIPTAPVLVGTSDIIGTEVDQWEINGIPCFFFIDKDFYLRIMQPGWNEETVTNNIEMLLAE